MRRFAGQAQPHSGATQFCSRAGLAPGGLVDPVGVARRSRSSSRTRSSRRPSARCSPTAAARRRPYPLISREHRLGVGLGVRARRRVVPGQVQQRAVASSVEPASRSRIRSGRGGRRTTARCGVAGRLDGLVAPLQQPLGVGERAVLLGVRGGGQEEHLGARCPRCASRRSRSPAPSFQNVALSIIARSRTTSQSRLAMPSRCSRPLRRADRRVLAEQEVALDLPVDLVHAPCR